MSLVSTAPLRTLRRFVVVAVVAASVATVVSIGSGCGPSRTVRHTNQLAAAARRSPTAAVVTLSPAQASPEVYVQGDSSGNVVLDVIGDVARDGGAKALRQKLSRIKNNTLNTRYASTTKAGIDEVWRPKPNGEANVVFELTIESVAIVAPSFAGEATAEIVVSGRAVSRKNRRVLWRVQDVVQRDIGSYVPLPRGAGGLYNLAAVAALSDKQLKQLFDGLAAEGGRVMARHIIEDSAD